jgi:isoleucyl-tRNA synthetase
VDLKQIYNKDLMYKGYTIQPYSPKAGTGLSSHEVNQPGSYRDVTDTTVVAQFKVLEESLSDLQRIFEIGGLLKIFFLSMDHYTVDFTK